MGKQTRSKTSQSFGKGKVTPMQIAFIVDRYLCDNNFTDTRSAFRTEAASLISKSPVQEAPKSLLSLGAMLNEFISLKEQKVIVDQERVRLEQEKIRVQNLLQGMQNVMNVYNSSGHGNAQTPVVQNSATRSVAALPHPGASAGGLIYSSPNVMPISVPPNVSKELGSFSSSVKTYPLTGKRSISNVITEVPSSSKKSRARLPLKKTPFTGTYNLSDKSPATQIPNVSAEKGSVLANQSPYNSTGPTTPPQAVSSLNGQSQSITPVGLSSTANCSNSNTPQETPANCTLITSERVTVSPCKHVSYTMERNQCISSSSPVKTTFKRFSKRENVKGRLDFDGTDTDVTNSFNTPIVDEISTSESEIFDIDFDSFDAFGASFSELLVDLDLGFDGLDCPCQPISELPIETSPGSSNESRDGNPGHDPVTSEFSSAVKDVNFEGSNTVTAVKSMTRCIILSPAKSHRSALVQENSLQV